MSARVSFAVLAAAASCTLVSLPAIAATRAPVAAAAPGTTDDPEALALGRSIVEVAFPPEARQAMMEKLMSTMLDQMRAGMQLDKVSDAGLRKILLDYLANIPAELRPLTTAFIPKQMEAVASAYAHLFSTAELKDIAAFARTPSGRNFLQRSTEVMSDPAVAAVNAAYFGELQTINSRTAPELARKVQAYVQAHPEAARDLPGTSPAQGAH